MFFSVSPLYLSLHTYSAAEGTGLGFLVCCDVLHVLVSPQCGVVHLEEAEDGVWRVWCNSWAAVAELFFSL